MTPNERFLNLRQKHYCIQCLFPGAFQNRRRHENGQCQRDFVCPCPAHSKYPVKKHVLLCHEHRDNKENQDLLETHKQRCIKGADLPHFVKDIKLSFHMSSHVNNTHKNKFPEQSQNSLEEKAIYMLQTINVDNHQYSIFYNTGCSEMVSRYKAVKSLRTRAIQEHAGPITIGGVGNSHIVSQHGIYKISLSLFNGENANL